MLVSSDELTERAEKKIGRILGERWRLDRLLGVGGMASVYAATHTNNQREAAIKVLHRELSVNEPIRKRFLREGYIANKVQHPGVAVVHDDGVDEDGSVFLVMDMFRGETLHERLRARGRRLEVSEILPIADALLDVLAVAHDAKVVHRDLKPENIFLTESGEVKILDFGIARVNEPRGELTTQAGALVGTPTYMPPEQVAGRMELIDGRTDLWAVGAIVFTCLTGRFVHEATQPNALLLRAMTEPAPKLADVLPDVSPAVAEVVDRALAFEREDRWPDARSMQAALRDALAGRLPSGPVPRALSITSTAPGPAPTPPRAPSGPQPAPKRGRRAFGTFLASLLLAAVGSFAWLRRREGIEPVPESALPRGNGTTETPVTAHAEGVDAATVATDAAAPSPSSAAVLEADASADLDAGDDDDGGEEEEDDDAGEDEEEEESDAAPPPLAMSPARMPPAAPRKGTTAPAKRPAAPRPAPVRKPRKKIRRKKRTRR